MFQRMPDSLRRWAMMALKLASTVPDPTLIVIRKCAMARFSRWPRTDCTSNQSSPRVISAARARPLRRAASILSGEVPIISIAR
jgi:hypothetical protein